MEEADRGFGWRTADGGFGWLFFPGNEPPSRQRTLLRLLLTLGGAKVKVLSREMSVSLATMTFLSIGRKRDSRQESFLCSEGRLHRSGLALSRAKRALISAR